MIRIACLAAALGAVTGCSLGVAPAAVDVNPTPPALAIVGPNEGLFYTAADDADPVKDGIQLTVRVDVDDEAIDTVDLALDANAATTEIVAEDLAGRRAAFFEVTLADAGDHPAVASAKSAKATAVLVAR